MRKLSTRARWAVPVAAVAAVGVVIAVSAVASASAPDLPARTAAQLLTEAQAAVVKARGPLTATLQETSNLGLPALPELAGQAGSPDPLAGTTTIELWYANPEHIRLAVPTQLGESDVRLDGTKLWLWDSKNQTATHVLLPAGALAGTHHLSAGGSGAESGSASFVPTPASMTRQLLAAIGPSTSVTVQENVTVAGRAAYQLAFAPRAAGSLVRDVVVAIDASTHLPLRIQVFVVGSSSPVFQYGFTALTFGAPAASNFTFTPPPGATVKTVKVPDSPMKNGPLGSLGALGQLGAVGPVTSPAGQSSASLGTGTGTSGSPGPQLKLSMTQLHAMQQGFAASLPKSMPKAQRAAAMKSFMAGMREQSMGRLQTGFAGGPVTANPLGGPPRVLGKGWLAVVATQPSPVVSALVAQALGGHQVVPPPGDSSSSSAVSSAYSSSLTITSAPAGPDLAVLRALLRATTPVSGSWGQGRLLRTSLLSVLIISNGRVLAGAVTPSVLYADAASLTR